VLLTCLRPGVPKRFRAQAWKCTTTPPEPSRFSAYGASHTAKAGSGRITPCAAYTPKSLFDSHAEYRGSGQHMLDTRIVFVSVITTDAAESRFEGVSRNETCAKRSVV
jgi:hypothetical protein